MGRNYTGGIYFKDGVYEVWHNGHYVARVKNIAEAEHLKWVAKANNQKGDPMAGVLAARQVRQEMKEEKAKEKAREKAMEKLRKRIERYRRLNADDLNDLAKWIREALDEDDYKDLSIFTNPIAQQKLNDILNQMKGEQ